MYSCPACGAENVVGMTACRCGNDLTLLRGIDAAADAWFNRGLEALAAGAPGRALEWLSACCVARPTDAAALRIQAKLWARLGHVREAGEALDRAAELDPSSPDLLAAREAIRAVVTPKRRKGKKSRRI
jgi:Tfp pilus assembly protein PilF